ncbi:translation initiation factor eIF-4B [Rhodotorula toruloides]|uniref:Translation initiation factor eIF-4B n=1 Tax=Rhodotorula toruloides TaxID=5286 RepID=A0A511KLW0_RHOTO|nr:translation initiation factor eIF-4B [Rhodotorula toruloides]
MDLNSFLADTTTGGSWADEMDELPTGPSAGPTFGEGPGLGGSHLTRGMGQGDRYGPRSGGPGGFGDRDDGRPPRAEVPFPTAPPYTAFVGNLSFETSEAEIEDFFTGLSVKSVRLVTGMDGKPRGFGYVEFETADSLSQALSASGHDLGGRVVRISVAEAQTSRMGRADEAGTWERTGPLPSVPGRSGGFGGGMSRDRGPPREGGFDEIERDAPIRGGKFAPSAPSEPRRGFSSYGAPAGGPGGAEGRPPRSFEPAPEIERDAPIRGGKFVPSAPPAGGERRTMFAERERTGPGADEAQTWERRGPLPGQQERKGFGSGFGATTPSDPPMTRRPLQLSARSASGTPGGSPPSSTPSTPAGTSSRASPFGAAKPIDTASKEREVEEKLAARPAPTLPEKRERKDRQEGGAGDKGEGAWVRKGPLAPAAAKPKEVAAPMPPAEKDSPPHAAGAKVEKPATRKEGFSYSNAAGKSEGAEVEEVAKGVEAL